jgi:hypothetical protein
VVLHVELSVPGRGMLMQVLLSIAALAAIKNAVSYASLKSYYDSRFSKITDGYFYGLEGR